MAPVPSVSDPSAARKQPRQGVGSAGPSRDTAGVQTGAKGERRAGSRALAALAGLPLTLLGACALSLDLDRFEFDPLGPAATRPLRPDAGADAGAGGCSPGAAGCGGGLGDGGSAEGDREPPAGLGDAAAPRSCDSCRAAENCVLSTCAPAAPSCAALKAADPDLGDGVYVLLLGGVPQRAYCDMTAQVVLCAELAGTHEGLTRDASRLEFSLDSVLEGDVCRVWNVRARVDGRPLDALEGPDDSTPASPCLPLGFRSDPPGYVRSSGCPFGADTGWSACGFVEESPLFKWSNRCDCVLEGDMNPGYYERYVLQGAIYQSWIPWNASGSISVSCGT